MISVPYFILGLLLYLRVEENSLKEIQASIAVVYNYTLLPLIFHSTANGLALVAFVTAYRKCFLEDLHFLWNFFTSRSAVVSPVSVQSSRSRITSVS